MARTNSIETIQKTLDLAGQELRILHQISQSISSTLDLDRVLREIIDLVVDVTRGDSCLVYLLDETGDNLVLRASKNPHPRLMGKIAMRIGEGITGWLAQEVQLVAIARNASASVRSILPKPLRWCSRSGASGTTSGPCSIRALAVAAFYAPHLARFATLGFRTQSSLCMA